MADEKERQGSELSDEQKKEIATWFLTNAPTGEIQYVAKDVRSVLMDDPSYEAVAAEAFPIYNKAHLVSLEMPDGSGDVIISKFGETGNGSYLDPRTAQVAFVDHIKQICTKTRPATDEELPSSYIEDFRSALDVELSKYVGETYPKGACAVYCTSGKDVEGPGIDFEFTVVISAARRSPQNFCNGSWRSIWIVEFKDDLQVVELKGKIQVGAHYFEEGNVQLDTNNECKDSTVFQSPEDSAISIANMIRHHETEYMVSLEASYLKLPDTTFKIKQFVLTAGYMLWKILLFSHPKSTKVVENVGLLGTRMGDSPRSTAETSGYPDFVSMAWYFTVQPDERYHKRARNQKVEHFSVIISSEANVLHHCL